MKENNKDDIDDKESNTQDGTQTDNNRTLRMLPPYPRYLVYSNIYQQSTNQQHNYHR